MTVSHGSTRLHMTLSHGHSGAANEQTPPHSLYGAAGRPWSPETACHQVRFRIQPRNPLLWLSTRGSAFFGLRCLRSQAIISRLLGLVESRRNSNEKGAHLECGHLSSSSATSRDCREVFWFRLNTEPFDFFLFRGFSTSSDKSGRVSHHLCTKSLFCKK